MSGPLDDVVVIDLTRALAGPHCGMMLADMGARVIKVETPGGGDESRGWGPPFVGPDDDPVSTYFLSCNRNKESVTLDLKSDDGREILEPPGRPRRRAARELPARRARPARGSASSGCTSSTPAWSLLSISGFGHDGPEGGRAGYDQIAQGEGGLMSLTGSDADHPQRVGVPIGDLLAGMYGAYGVVSALHERNRTGRGRVVRTSLLASIVGVHAFQGTRYTVAGEVGPRRRQPPPVDLPLRPVHLRRRHDPALLRQRGAVAEAGRGLRARPVRPRLRHQPRAGRQPRRRDRDCSTRRSPTSRTPS